MNGRITFEIEGQAVQLADKILKGIPVETTMVSTLHLRLSLNYKLAKELV